MISQQLKSKPRLAFFISGRGSNMMAVIRKINEGRLKAKAALVFSDVADAEGLKKAEKENIKTLHLAPKQFEKHSDYEARLREILVGEKIEFIVCAGYMRLIKKNLLEAFPGRIFNIHPSLLPAFPGLNAQKQAIDYKVKISGCTVHFVDAGMDTGPIIAQSACEVKTTDTVETLAKRILKLEHELYWRAIRSVIQAKS